MIRNDIFTAALLDYKYYECSFRLKENCSNTKINTKKCNLRFKNLKIAWELRVKILLCTRKTKEICFIIYGSHRAKK